MSTASTASPQPLTESLERLRDVIWRPNARIYAAPDVYDWLVRASHPSPRRGYAIPPGVVLVRSEHLSPGTIVGLAPLPSLTEPYTPPLPARSSEEPEP